MKKYHIKSLSLFLLLIISCSKDSPITKIEEEVEENVNLAPNNFEIEIVDVSHNSATISWNQAIDPESDPVTYSVYLNQMLIAENITDLTYQFSDLEELNSYSGNIIAKDSNNNETSKTFLFETEKYYLKFLKRYDYGEVNYLAGAYAVGGPFAMILTHEQNYIIAGKSEYPNGNGYRFFVSKIDYNGNEIWKKYYDYQVGDAGDFEIIQSTTGYLLAGLYHLLSLDNDGNLIWYKIVDGFDAGQNASEIKSIVQDSNGNIFLVGSRDVPEGQIQREGLLIKLDITGNFIWERTFRPTIFMNEFDDIVITPSNDLVILGSTDTSGATLEEYFNDPSSVLKVDFWVVKTNIEGEMIWENTFGDALYDIPKQIIVKTNGNYAFAGFVRPLYNMAGRIFEISSAGDEIWNTSTGLSSTFWIDETIDGGIIATGHIDFGNYGALGLFKFDSNGNNQWIKSYQESFTFLYGRAVVVEQDGGYRIAGSSGKLYYYDGERPNLLVYKTDPEGNFE